LITFIKLKRIKRTKINSNEENIFKSYGTYTGYRCRFCI
jgi:hypothetical protein